MNGYNSEISRCAYNALQEGTEEMIDVTLEIANKVLLKLTYGTHTSLPQVNGELAHTKINRKILERPNWYGKGGVKNAIQNIINLPNSRIKYLSPSKSMETQQAA